MDLEHLKGYLPIRLYRQGASSYVDWCYVGTKRLTEPFFDQTVEACFRSPFSLLFRPQTPIEVLGELAEAEPGLSPKGFIFHMSRCGSSLVGQMLIASPRNVVISEADPIHWTLRADHRDEGITEETRATWLQWMVSALGRRRSGREENLFLKFDSWSLVDLPLIQRAFPSVPWIFLYREPVEVMVSHLRRRGAHTVPGLYGAKLLNLPATELPRIRPEEYCARVLGRICEAAVEHHDAQGLLVNYTQLPEVLWTRVLDHFGTPAGAAEVEAMRRITQFDAKTPGLRFARDAEQKNHEASGLVRDLAATWVEPVYRRLEAMRRDG
jgi:hypothetical protein